MSAETADLRRADLSAAATAGQLDDLMAASMVAPWVVVRAASKADLWACALAER